MRFIGGTLPYNGAGLSTESAEERAQKQRIRYMARFDSMPADAREAVRNCPWDIWIMLQPRGLNWGLMIEKIEALSSAREAAEFNQMYGRG